MSEGPPLFGKAERLGLGTWKLTGERCRRAVEHALQLGYRHVDTAQGYENEQEVGQALCSSGIRRDELFVTTKVWPDHLSAEGDAIVRRSLDRLRLAQVDLLLVHWPSPHEPLQRALTALARVHERGLARHVGVSNFTIAQLEEATRIAPIACNQIERHPYLQQQRLVQRQRQLGVETVAYSPLAFGKVAADPVLRGIGERLGRSAAQVALGWSLQQGIAVVPKAASPEHLRDNLGARDVVLEDADLAAIGALERGERLIDPDFAPAWDG